MGVFAAAARLRSWRNKSIGAQTAAPAFSITGLDRFLLRSDRCSLIHCVQRLTDSGPDDPRRWRRRRDESRSIYSADRRRRADVLTAGKERRGAERQSIKRQLTCLHIFRSPILFFHAE